MYVYSNVTLLNLRKASYEVWNGSTYDINQRFKIGIKNGVRDLYFLGSFEFFYIAIFIY